MCLGASGLPHCSVLFSHFSTSWSVPWTVSLYLSPLLPQNAVQGFLPPIQVLKTLYQGFPVLIFPNSLLWSKIRISLYSFIFHPEFNYGAIKHNTSHGSKVNTRKKAQLSTLTIKDSNTCQQIPKTACIKLITPIEPFTCVEEASSCSVIFSF